MPHYDYKCNLCNSVSEVFHTMSEVGQERACVICSGKLKMLLSTPLQYINYDNTLDGKSSRVGPARDR